MQNARHTRQHHKKRELGDTARLSSIWYHAYMLGTLWRHVRSIRLRRRDLLAGAVGAAIVLGGAGIHQLIYNSQVAIPYLSGGITAKWIPATVKHWSPMIDEMAQRYNLDPNFIAIIMTMESGGDANAVSPDNAQGLMQVTPLTAGDIAKRYLKTPANTYNLMDPQTNIEFGVAYLAELRDIYGEPAQSPTWNYSVELVAAAYNGGFGAANSIYKGEGLTDTQTLVYSRDAFNMWRERRASDSPTFDRWVERGGSALLDAAKQSQQ